MEDSKGMVWINIATVLETYFVITDRPKMSQMFKQRRVDFPVLPLVDKYS